MEKFTKLFALLFGNFCTVLNVAPTLKKVENLSDVEMGGVVIDKFTKHHSAFLLHWYLYYIV